MKQITKLKRETEKFTITVRDFNTPLSLIGRTTILKKKRKEPQPMPHTLYKNLTEN